MLLGMSLRHLRRAPARQPRQDRGFTLCAVLPYLCNARRFFGDTEPGRAARICFPLTSVGGVWASESPAGTVWA